MKKDTKEIAVESLKHLGSAVGGTLVGSIVPRFSLLTGIASIAAGVATNTPELITFGGTNLGSGAVFAGATGELAGEDDKKGSLDKLKTQAKGNLLTAAKGLLKTTGITKIDKKAIDKLDKKFLSDPKPTKSISGLADVEDVTPVSEIVKVEMLDTPSDEMMLQEQVTPADMQATDNALEQLLSMVESTTQEEVHIMPSQQMEEAEEMEEMGHYNYPEEVQGFEDEFETVEGFEDEFETMDGFEDEFDSF